MFEICAFQHAIDQAHSPGGRRLHMQDALALHTRTQLLIWQKPNAQWPAQRVADGFAWLSVADGVSASPCADLASRSFLRVLHEAATQADWPFAPDRLPARVRAARGAWSARHLKPHTLGASTTLTTVMLAGGQVCAVNCGDSRIWRLRPQASGNVQWLQLSRDHTVWQQMLDDGEAAPAQKEQFASIYQGLLHCLTLGDSGEAPDAPDDDDAWDDPPLAPENWLHIWQGRHQPGDIYLLATDGLHETLGDKKLQALWKGNASLNENLQALRQAYLRAGAPDDCSVIACRVTQATTTPSPFTRGTPRAPPPSRTFLPAKRW